MSLLLIIFIEKKSNHINILKHTKLVTFFPNGLKKLATGNYNKYYLI